MGRKKIIRTADNKPFESTQRYWFYDVQMKQVRTTVSLRSDGEYLCSFGLRVVPIWKLREHKGDAAADGRKVLNEEILEIKATMDILES